MRLYPRCVVVLMVLLVPATARASDHVASIFGGYSALFASRENGFNLGLEVSWPTTNAIHDHLGILVDGGSHGETDAHGNKVTKKALLFGLRAIYKIPQAPRLVLFAHGLIGRHWSKTGTFVDDGWAGGTGGGLDVLLFDTSRAGWAGRAQLDFVRIAGDTSPRLSTGVVFRFK
jgi:hypothetical protein